MSDLNVTIRFEDVTTGPQPTPNTRIVETLGYGDEMMVRRLELDTRITSDNFNHVDYWTWTGIRSGGIHTADWKAVTKFQRLGRAEFEFLASIQPDDYHIWGYPLAQKLNWLIGQRDGSAPARPYWTRGGSWDENWTDFEFGAMVFGHSSIRVKTNADGSLKVTRFLTDYYDLDQWRVGEIEFVEVDGFKPHMMDRTKYPVEWLLEHAYIQQATAANSRPVHNTIDHYPRGVMYHPVWDASSWPSNYGSALYIARFCIKE